MLQNALNEGDKENDNEDRGTEMDNWMKTSAFITSLGRQDVYIVIQSSCVVDMRSTGSTEFHGLRSFDESNCAFAGGEKLASVPIAGDLRAVLNVCGTLR